MSTPIVNESARRRKRKVEPEFGFNNANIERYRVRAATALKVENLLNEAAGRVNAALEMASKESSNGTSTHGTAPILEDEKYVRDLHLDLIDVLLKVRDVAQTRVRSLRLMEEFSGEGD